MMVYICEKGRVFIHYTGVATCLMLFLFIS